MKDYNFFSAFEKKKLAIDPKSPSFIIAVALIVALIFCGGIALGNFLFNQKLYDITDALNAKKASPQYIEVQKIQEELAALELYDKMADQVVADYGAASILESAFFSDFSKLMPQNVRLNSLTVTGNAVSLQCMSADKKAFAVLLSQMNDSGLFASSQLVSVSATIDLSGGAGNIADIQAILKAGESE